jgi:hypothetical protein
MRDQGGTAVPDVAIRTKLFQKQRNPILHDPSRTRGVPIHNRYSGGIFMSLGKVLLGGTVIGIATFFVYGLIDGMLLASTYASIVGMPDMKAVPIYIWLIYSLLGGWVFAWFYSRVKDSFAPGLAGGITFGLYAGIFLSFPMMIQMHLLVKGYPYWLGWFGTAEYIGIGVLSGAIIGLMNKGKNG